MGVLKYELVITVILGYNSQTYDDYLKIYGLSVDEILVERIII